MNNEKQEEIKKIKQSGAISKSNIIVRFPKWIDKSQNVFLQHILIDRDKNPEDSLCTSQKRNMSFGNNLNTKLIRKQGSLSC